MAGFSMRLTLLLTAITSLVDAAPRRTRPGSCDKLTSVGKAVYFITNEAENAVVALPIGPDGKLSNGTLTKTGGAGSININGATGQPGVPDALVSQSSLTVVGNNIFAVNAGSNTLTMLAINPADPKCLTVVGNPVSVPGEFPNTVTASTKNKLVCVGTTGAVSGISCAPFSKRGLGQMDTLRPFDLGQSTPPVGPTNTVSQTFFSQDGMRLYTTVKGDPMKNNTGFLSVFNVEQKGRQQASVSVEEVRSSPNGTAVLFGSFPIPGDESSIFATDASFGAAILSVDQTGQATARRSQMIQGQAATCWSIVSRATNTAFVADAGRPVLVEMSLEDATIIKELDLSTNGVSGLFDMTSAGNFLYALSPGNGSTIPAITVLDVSGGAGSAKQAQHFTLEGFATSSAQGMAVLV